MARLTERPAYFSDALVIASLFLVLGGSLMLMLRRWLGLDDIYEQVSMIAIQFGAGLFAIFLVLFVFSVIFSGVARLFRGKRS
jgi:hypothetical protein